MVVDQEDQYPGDLVDTISVTARADLTDGQWAVLERLLPKGGSRVARRSGASGS
jgi:hypothetical protein